MKTPRYTTLLLALATLSATALTCSAQNTNAAGQNSYSNYPTQSQPAPVQRVGGPVDPAAAPAYPGRAPMPSITSTQPAPGIFLKATANSSVQTVSATPGRTELRLDHGLINVNVHHPAQHAVIQVDLPGGQTNILKNGLYTFNADTNTVRVLKGEAVASPAPGAKPLKIKEFHQLIFNGPNARSIEVGPRQAFADMLPVNNGDRPGGYYGDGYPPYAYGYPYGFYGGYPFGFGLGFGYFGGFGGFRGGFRR